jgi:hypothetical protein
MAEQRAAAIMAGERGNYSVVFPDVSEREPMVEI